MMNNKVLVDRDFLFEIRNYFGEHDATPFEHNAFSVIDRAIKESEKLKQAAVGDCFTKEGVSDWMLNNALDKSSGGYNGLVDYLNTRATEWASGKIKEYFTTMGISIERELKNKMFTEDQLKDAIRVAYVEGPDVISYSDFEEIIIRTIKNENVQEK